MNLLIKLLAVLPILFLSSVNSNLPHSEAVSVTQDCHCNYDNLQIRKKGGSMGGGNGAIDIAIKNTSKESCCLKGYPQIKLYDDRGRLVDIKIANTGNTFFIPSAPDNEVTIKGGKEAYFQIEYVVGSKETDCIPVSKIVVQLPGSSKTLELPIHFIPAKTVKVTPVLSSK